MCVSELRHLVDHAQCIQIALALCAAPGEEPVAAKQDAVARGLLLNCSLHHHGELKPRPLPWHPDQLVAVAAIELLHLLASVGGSSYRDCAVRMQMIDMRKGKKAVQRSIDGC